MPAGRAMEADHQGDQSCVNSPCRGAAYWVPRRCSPRRRSSGRRARRSQCVVGTWGGDYARLLRENIDDPILKPAGIEVVQDVGDESPRVVQAVRAEEAAARHVDIACVGALNGYRVNEAELVEELDEKKVPNLKHVQSKTCACRPSCRTSTARRCWCTTPTR